MGKNCCEGKSEALTLLREKQGKVLKIVLALNLVMFGLEFTFGILADSTALLADSLDMLGDAAVYAFSLYVLAKSIRWRAGSSLLKGLIMLAFGFVVLGEAISKSFSTLIPDAPTIGLVGLLALCVNAVCLWLLWSHKEDDINMRSTWICSRNDIIANCGVLLAAGATALTQTKWFDIGIGMIIATLFLKSAMGVIQESRQVLKAHPRLQS